MVNNIDDYLWSSHQSYLGVFSKSKVQVLIPFMVVHFQYVHLLSLNDCIYFLFLIIILM